jgi:hypothetical protein
VLGISSCLRSDLRRWWDCVAWEQANADEVQDQLRTDDEVELATVLAKYLAQFDDEDDLQAWIAGCALAAQVWRGK